MKKFYMALLLTSSGLCAFAQTTTSAELEACRYPNGGLEIKYDAGQNCNAAGTFEGINELGFHSGTGPLATPWQTVVDWNAPTAVRAERIEGENKFKVEISNVESYYGAAGDNIGLVFNQGPVNDAMPWDKKGEGLKDDGTCGDLYVIGISSLPLCNNNTNELSLKLGVRVSPNPVSGIATVQFNNPIAADYAVNLVNLTGQVVRSYGIVSDSQVSIAKDGLASGVYFLTFRNEKGETASQKVIME